MLTRFTSVLTRFDTSMQRVIAYEHRWREKARRRAPQPHPHNEPAHRVGVDDGCTVRPPPLAVPAPDAREQVAPWSLATWRACYAVTSTCQMRGLWQTNAALRRSSFASYRRGRSRRVSIRGSRHRTIFSISLHRGRGRRKADREQRDVVAKLALGALERGLLDMPQQGGEAETWRPATQLQQAVLAERSDRSACL